MNLERVALLEHQLGSLRNKGSGASKIYDSILDLLLNSKQAIRAKTADITTTKSTEISQNDEKFGEVGAKMFERQEELTNLTKSSLTPRDLDIAENSTDKNTVQEEPPVCENKRNSDESSVKYETNNSVEDVPLFGGKKDAEKTVNDEFSNLLDIFEARLKNCLKEQLKLTSNAKTTSSTQHKERENVLKRMFEHALRASLARKSEKITSVEECEKVLETIFALEKLRNNAS